jgi:DNA transformation protein and related proteins
VALRIAWHYGSRGITDRVALRIAWRYGSAEPNRLVRPLGNPALRLSLPGATPPSNMSLSDGYRAFVLEQMERVCPVTAKSMFGGVGLYSQGLFFALIAEDRLYFKVDDATRLDFERLGMEPFRPFEEDKAMGYYEVPVDVLEDVAQLESWMRKAIQVAVNAKQGKPKRSRRSRSP